MTRSQQRALWLLRKAGDGGVDVRGKTGDGYCARSTALSLIRRGLATPCDPDDNDRLASGVRITAEGLSVVADADAADRRKVRRA